METKHFVILVSIIHKTFYFNVLKAILQGINCFVCVFVTWLYFFICVGQLLLPTENIMEIFLLCTDCCIYLEIHQSLWQWPFGDVLYRLQWTLDLAGVDSLYSHWSTWGTVKHFPVYICVFLFCFGIDLQEHLLSFRVSLVNSSSSLTSCGVDIGRCLALETIQSLR